MAYITTEEVKVIRNNIKKAFPAKQGWKFSVTCRNYSSVRVAIMSAPKEYEFEGHYPVNHHMIESDFKENPKQGDVITKLHNIISKEHWDDSDIMTDYFNCAFYITIQVGKWDKDCVMSEKK